jgi:predicted Fe-Mo cluster-binding NifX family protein
MRILVAADGDSPESRVSRKLVHATDFLEISAETGAVTARESITKRSRQEIFREAAAYGVETIITGSIGPHAASMIGTYFRQVAFAPGIPVREAVRLFVSGELKWEDTVRARRTLEEHAVLHRQKRQEHGRHQRQRGTRITEPTPRGQHHLQQFSGRGH